jgi:hypothetical protein
MKCAICETSRSNEGRLDGTVSQTNENGSKKRTKEQKSTIQATLFGGIAANAESRTVKAKKSKRSAEIDVAVKPKLSCASIRPSTALTYTVTNNQFEIWKEVAKNDIPFSKLEERTRSAMKQIFNVNKLRLLQPKAVKCALKRNSQIVVMATGGGMYLQVEI